MNTQERIDKMLKKADKILLAGKPNKQQLKPCPFCGADEDSGLHIETIWDDKEKFRIMCENCRAEIGDFKTIEEAVEAWNRRAE